MSPIYGYPGYDFPDEISTDKPPKERDDVNSSEMAMWYTMVLILIIVIWLVLYFSLRLLTLRQKTRNPQQRRGYMGSRSQTTLPPSEPTIYVSPANLPPPPKYEAMAPPSYEEVVGIHCPAYQPPTQPISQPITTALATQSSSPNTTSNVESDSTNSHSNTISNTVTSTFTNNIINNVTNNVRNNVLPNETTTITTVDERRPVTASS